MAMHYASASAVRQPVVIHAPGNSAKPRQKGKSAYTVAVTSGKGGVGKTNVTVGLATLLARRHKVILVDGDMGLANADILCGASARQHMGHVLAGQASMESILVATSGGFQLVPGASGIASLAALDAMQRGHLLNKLEPLQTAADILLFDTGAGIGREVLTFTRHVDHVVLVTTPEPTAMLDAYAVLKVLTRESITGKISLVVNQARSAEDAVIVHANIVGVAQQFLKTEVPLMGHVLADPNVPAAVRRRASFVSLFPDSPASSSLKSVSHAIERLAIAAQIQETPSFFRRVMDWCRQASQ